jgi:UDP-N-acetylglucosamine:LPS N-acetylglucosamine transferase
MTMPGKLKVCLAASGGGHLTELLKLAPIWAEHAPVFVTTHEAVVGELRKRGTVYVVGECNRRMPLKTLQVFARCARVVLRERPDVIVSTGAAAGCMLCLLGKLVGAKVVWVDSIANVQRISMSGRIIRPFANLFLTQWPELANKGHRIQYVGELI